MGNVVSAIGSNNYINTARIQTKCNSQKVSSQLNSDEDGHNEEEMNSSVAINSQQYAKALNSSMMNSAMNFQQSAPYPSNDEGSNNQPVDTGPYTIAAQELQSPEPMRQEGQYINAKNLKADENTIYENNLREVNTPATASLHGISSTTF